MAGRGPQRAPDAPGVAPEPPLAARAPEPAAAAGTALAERI